MTTCLTPQGARTISQANDGHRSAKAGCTLEAVASMVYDSQSVIGWTFCELVACCVTFDLSGFNVCSVCGTKEWAVHVGNTKH